MISGNFSMFSIINDLTMPQQYKDSDIISGFAKIKSDALKFDKINQSKFMICHSQCDVSYIIDGFKTKNQDKVLP
jgi:myosin heavy subunit